MNLKCNCGNKPIIQRSNQTLHTLNPDDFSKDEWHRIRIGLQKIFEVFCPVCQTVGKYAINVDIASKNWQKGKIINPGKPFILVDKIDLENFRVNVYNNVHHFMYDTKQWHNQIKLFFKNKNQEIEGEVQFEHVIDFLEDKKASSVIVIENKDQFLQYMNEKDNHGNFCQARAKVYNAACTLEWIENHDEDSNDLPIIHVCDCGDLPIIEIFHRQSKHNLRAYKIVCHACSAETLVENSIPEVIDQWNGFFEEIE